VNAILVAITELASLGYKAYMLYLEAKRKGWINEGRSLSVKISEAKTDEERAELARHLFEHKPR